MLSEVMPFPALAHLTDEDAKAIVAFLKSLPPVKNKVAGPFGPNDKATTFVSVVLSAAISTWPPAAQVKACRASGAFPPAVKAREIDQA